jgi:hypothetical protein
MWFIRFLKEAWVGNLLLLISILATPTYYFLFRDVVVDCVAVHLSKENSNDIKLVSSIEEIIHSQQLRKCGDIEFDNFNGKRHLSVDYFSSNENIKTKADSLSRDLSQKLPFGRIFANKESTSGFREYFTERRKIGLYLQP